MTDQAETSDFLFVATKNGLRTFRRPLDDAPQVVHTLPGREMTTVSAQGQTLLAGATDGLLRSEDLGQTWRTAGVGLTEPHLRRVRYHPGRPGVALAGTEPAAIFRTDDNAKSWRECPEVARLRDENDWYLPYSPAAGCVRGFAFHGERAYAAVEQGGLLRSDDGGATWRLVRGSSGDPRAALPAGAVHTDVHSVVVHPSSPDHVIAPTGGGLYRSEDGGERWVHLYDCYCRAVWVNPEDAGHMVFGPADGVDRNGRIEVTGDGGATWEPAGDGIDAPWSGHMVERFLRWNEELLAVLSNGHLVAASLDDLVWRRVLPEVDDALAVAVR